MKNKLTALLILLSFYGYSQKKDTIPVVMLVCDTAVYGRLFPYEIPNVYWIRGYEIKEEVRLKGNIADEAILFNQTIGYLDKNKKPITLVVWDKRSINK